MGHGFLNNPMPKNQLHGLYEHHILKALTLTNLNLKCRLCLGRFVKARKSLNFAAKMNGSALPRDLDITEDTSTSTVSLNLFSLGKEA
jgi:hypothetical protein